MWSEAGNSSNSFDYYTTKIPVDRDIDKMGVRFTIKVTPLDGSPASILCKTFELNVKGKYTGAH